MGQELAVAHDDPRWDETGTLHDLSPHRLREFENFFETCRALEGRQTDTGGEPANLGTWR
jgi:inorganic pyrophosphatase